MVTFASFMGQFLSAKQNIFFAQFTLDRNYRKHDLLIGLSIKNNLYDDNTIATESIKNGKHVITANKALIAQHGDEIFKLAKESKTFFGFGVN